MTRDNQEALTQHPKEFPHRDLFFKYLQKWEQVNQFTYDILIKDINIKVNISKYFKEINKQPWITNPIYNSLRLVREILDASTKQDITKRHTTSALSYGDKNPTETLIFYYSQDCIFVGLKLQGNYKRF